MIKKYFLRIGSGVLFTSLAAGVCFAQDTTTTTKTTTVKETTRNADGSYTVIEYPAGKEVMVNLSPTTMIPGAKGTARVMRMGSETSVNLDLSGLSGDMSNYYVYAVDPAGATTLLGPLNVTNGTGTLSVKTPMDKFMLVLSPEENLSAIGSDTKVVLRSSVPQGFAIVPTSAVGSKQAAISVPTNAYNVPLLGVPSFKNNTNEIRVKFGGDFGGMKGKAYIKPRKDGAKQIKMRFDDMKLAPKGDRRFVLWAVSPENKYIKLGQVINTGERQEAEIRSETRLSDFGLFVTMETTDVDQPSGVIVTTFGGN